MDINSVTLTGRLTRDPELRYTQQGTAICNFTLAVNGAKENEVSFINILTWKQTAENCAEYLKKGSKVALTGKLNQRTYDGKNGKVNMVEVIAYQVQFISGTKKETKTDEPFANVSEPVDISDDLPFDSTDDGLPEVEYNINKVSNNRRRFRHGTSA